MILMGEKVLPILQEATKHEEDWKPEPGKTVAGQA